MKIGIITNLYPPYARGGAENVVVRTIEELTNRGHDVFVITAMPTRKRKRIVLNTNASERIYQFSPGNLYFTLDDHKYPAWYRFFWHVLDAFNWRSNRITKEILIDERPDVVITHNLKGIGLGIANTVQHMGIPHMHVVHDLQLLIPSGLKFYGKEEPSWYERIPLALYRSIVRMKLGKPNSVIFPSEYLRNEYLSHGLFKNANVRVIPNPAPDFSALTYKERHSGPLNLLFVGQLEDHKGVNFLLDVFKSTDIHANLIIAGEGSLRSRVQKYADRDKRITYLGFIATDQLLNCFEIADAMIVPSLCYENSPTVIYESLQSGIPVIASRIGGVGELVEDGVNGFLFEPGSQADLMRTLNRMDAARDQFAATRDDIRKTVAPYALKTYTETLVTALQELQGTQTRSPDPDQS